VGRGATPFCPLPLAGFFARTAPPLATPSRNHYARTTWRRRVRSSPLCLGRRMNYLTAFNLTALPSVCQAARHSNRSPRSPLRISPISGPPSCSIRGWSLAPRARRQRRAQRSRPSRRIEHWICLRTPITASHNAPPATTSKGAPSARSHCGRSSEKESPMSQPPPRCLVFARPLGTTQLSSVAGFALDHRCLGPGLGAPLSPLPQTGLFSRTLFPRASSFTEVLDTGRHECFLRVACGIVKRQTPGALG
jgi:hypothetical protein